MTHPDRSTPEPPTIASYVYCLVVDDEPPALDAAVQGPPGAGPPRLLVVGEPAPRGAWLVVATVPLDDYGEAAIERGLEDLSWVSDRAVGHERVVERLLADLLEGRSPHRALVPLKLFTLFADDQRALAWIAGERRRLEALAERLAGRVELGVRIRFDTEGARRAAEAEAAPPASGTDFLRSKKRRRDAVHDAGPRAADAAARALRELSAGAVETRRRSVPEGAAGVLVDAAFLLPAADLGAFEGRVGSVSRQLLDSHCQVTLTGPWPPYHFVGDER